MNEKILENKGFNYVALGHIHKTNFEPNTNFYFGILAIPLKTKET